jgi:plastocyanin
MAVNGYEEGGMVRIVGRGIPRGGVGGATLAVALALALSAAPTALAAAHSVAIAGFAFSPQSITIHVGDTVTWANSDAQGHTATADDGSWQTGTISGNTSKSLTFATAGTFAYHCSIHQQMTATLVVSAAAPATDAAPTTDEDDVGDPGPGVLLVLLGAVIGLVVGGWRFTRRA